MSHTVSQGFEMVEAQEKNQRIVQIGSQRVSSALCAKAREIYAAGTIGDIEMVELTYGRNSPNGAWEYPPPPDLSPSNVDWDIWLNDAPRCRSVRSVCPLALLERVWNRRRRRLDGALISGMLFTLGWNEAPDRLPLGRHLPLEGRPQYARFHAVLFDYHGIPGLCAARSGLRHARNRSFPRPEGRHGSPGQQPSRHAANGRGRFARVTIRPASPPICASSMSKNGTQSTRAPSARNRSTGDLAFEGEDWDDLKPHLWTFFQATKTRQPGDRGRCLRQSRCHRLPHGQ